MTVSGIVYNATLTLDGFTKFWVRDPKSKERTCVIGDESTLSRKVSIGEEIWWQSGTIYVHRSGRDVPFRKIGYAADAGKPVRELAATDPEPPAALSADKE